MGLYAFLYEYMAGLPAEMKINPKVKVMIGKIIDNNTGEVLHYNLELEHTLNELKMSEKFRDSRFSHEEIEGVKSICSKYYRPNDTSTVCEINYEYGYGGAFTTIFAKPELYLKNCRNIKQYIYLEAPAIVYDSMSSKVRIKNKPIEEYPVEFTSTYYETYGNIMLIKKYLISTNDMTDINSSISFSWNDGCAFALTHRVEWDTSNVINRECYSQTIMLNCDDRVGFSTVRPSTYLYDPLTLTQKAELTYNGTSIVTLDCCDRRLEENYYFKWDKEHTYYIFKEKFSAPVSSYSSSSINYSRVDDYTFVSSKCYKFNIPEFHAKFNVKDLNESIINTFSIEFYDENDVLIHVVSTNSIMELHTSIYFNLLLKENNNNTKKIELSIGKPYTIYDLNIDIYIPLESGDFEVVSCSEDYELKDNVISINSVNDYNNITFEIKYKNEISKLEYTVLANYMLWRTKTND